MKKLSNTEAAKYEKDGSLLCKCGAFIRDELKESKEELKLLLKETKEKGLKTAYEDHLVRRAGHNTDVAAVAGFSVFPVLGAGVIAQDPRTAFVFYGLAAYAAVKGGLAAKGNALATERMKVSLANTNN